MIALGETSTVYEATQLDLDRRVALKVFARQSMPTRWPEHPNIVAVYTAGSSSHGDFVAMQLVRGGRTLADSSLRSREARGVVADVTSALGAAHSAGFVHGAIAAENVLLDPSGRALLAGLRPGDESDAAADRAALAVLTRELLPAHRARAAAAVALLAAVILAVVVLTRPQAAPEPPPVLAGAAVLGSALTSGPVESLDCNGTTPSGASPACSIAQTTLSGRAITVRRAGVIRRWTVRGANGALALQVLRKHGNAYFMVAHTSDVSITDRGVHALPANLPVAPGDLVALEVAPGATVGVRRAGASRTARWFGPLVYEVRPPERAAGTGFDHELLLRVEYVPGAAWSIEGALGGSAAESAPAGRVAGRLVAREGAHPIQLVVARAQGAIVVDLVNDGRRVMRIPLTDAETSGSLNTIEVRKVRFGLPIVRIRWQNRNELVTHEFVVHDRALTLLG